MRRGFFSALILCGFLTLVSNAFAGGGSVGASDPNDKHDRYSRYRNDPEWQAERKRRKLLRELREQEERRLYQEWLNSSSVTCFQSNVPIITVDQAKTVVPSTSQWPQLSFSDGDLNIQRSIGLLSPTLSCAYQHHDPAYVASSGRVFGGFQQAEGANQFQGAQIMTCYRNGAQIAQERINNASVTWNGTFFRVDFQRGNQQSDSVVIDTLSTGCILERA